MNKVSLLSFILAEVLGTMTLARAAVITPTAPSAWPAVLSDYSTSGVPMRGFNLSGAEFQPTSGAYNFNNFPSIEDTIYFAYLGENTVRVPFAWEYLQPGLPDSTALIDFTTPSGYGNQLLQLLSNLTNQGLTVVLDMHDYMRYETNLDNYSNNSNPNDTSIIDTAGEPSAAQYASAWYQIAQAVNTYLTPAQSQHVIFELMNEPHNMGIPLLSTGDVGPQAVLDLENNAMGAIRNAEAKYGGIYHTVLLDGDNYTGLHNWTTQTDPSAPDDAATNATTFISKYINDPQHNYMIDVHQYMDSDYSGTQNSCIPAAAFQSQLASWGPDFMQWAAQNAPAKIFLGEFGAPDSTASVPSDCQSDMNQLLSFVMKNPYNGSYGFTGYTSWSTGHAWGSYLLNLSPGGPANGWTTDNNVFANPAFLTEAGSLPPLGNQVAELINKTAYPLVFSSSSGAFQTSTPGNIAPGQAAFLYTDSSGNITEKTEATYQSQVGNSGQPVTYYGFGVTQGKGYGFSYPDNAFVQYVDDSGVSHYAQIVPQPASACVAGIHVSSCYGVETVSSLQ